MAESEGERVFEVGKVEVEELGNGLRVVEEEEALNRRETEEDGIEKGEGERGFEYCWRREWWYFTMFCHCGGFVGFSHNSWSLMGVFVMLGYL